MKTKETKAWRDYEAGKDYKTRLGLYETVRRNERFYRGDQWHGVGDELPHPVFNLVRRITDYLVASVLPGDVSIRYSDDKLPFVENAAMRARIEEGLSVLEQNTAYRWKRTKMSALTQRALRNAALSGDAVFYCWWDASYRGGQPFWGEICTDLIDSTNLFVADVTKTDLQAQDYVMLSGRALTESLRREALDAGHSREDVRLILPDEDNSSHASDLGAIGLKGDEKTTYLLRFFRENGEVVFEKATRHCVIRRVHTGLRYYPVAYFNWYPTKDSFHGNAPVSDMIANQRYINTAYAMVMKHMYDTAFSKIIYDKSRIPEWSNEVGEAIAAVGGGSVEDAVSVVESGKLQDGYLELIDHVVENTKNMMGATEAALGDAQANNTSAILVLQQASRIALTQVTAELCRCIGEIAAIWADLLCTNSPPGRLLITEDGHQCSTACPDYALLKGELLRANAEITEVTGYTPAATVTLLDKLLDAGKISLEQYVELLPDGTLPNRASFLQKIQEKGLVTHE